jgi:hypothetical protein
MVASATKSPSRADLLRGPLALAAAGAAGVAVMRVLEPSHLGFVPPCPFLALTGLWCPFCGGTRAVDALASGELAAALGLNLLVVLAVPVLLVAWARWTADRARGRPARLLDVSSRTLAVVATLVVVYGVLRNLPGLEVLTPGG